MSDVQKDLTRAYAALAAGAVCIGCSAIFVKVAAVPGPTSAFYRVLFAAAGAVPWCLWRRPSLPARGTLLLTLAGGVFLAIDLVLWQVAVLVTSAANATLLVNLAPVWVGLGALVLFREWLGPFFWSGLVLALAGMALVVSGGSRQLASLGSGDLLAVGASFFYGLYLLVTQRARGSTETLSFLALSLAPCVVLSLAICLLTGAPLGGFGGRAWAALAALGLLSHLAGYVAINYALGHLRATSVSIILLSQPVITALLSIPLLDESLSAQQAVGGALVMLGIYLVNRRGSSRASTTRQSLPGLSEDC